MAPNYVLSYFPIKALGEPIRLLLVFGNIAFEDRRIEEDDWPKYKDSMPMAQMPVLQIDDKVVHQSVAISRYLGKQLGLAGSNDWENLQIDIAVDNLQDFKQKLIAGFYETNEVAKEEKYKVLLAETIPFFLKKLESTAAENEGHMALGKLTWADFYLTGIVDYLKLMCREDFLASNPNLKAAVDNVLALPAIKSWYAKAPKTEL